MSDKTLNEGAPTLEVTIEIPRGSFLKRGSDGHVDFVSPLPCPYNYGSVEDYIGGEGDYLDAVVLGPRLPLGARVNVRAYGAIGMSEWKEREPPYFKTSPFGTILAERSGPIPSLA